MMVIDAHADLMCAPFLLDGEGVIDLLYRPS